MQCADITFSTQAVPVSDDVCFNSTGVGSAPFTYNGDTDKAVNETCDTASESTEDTKDDKKNAASNLKVSVASVGVVGLVMAAMMV